MVPWRNAISCIHNWIVCCSTICVHIVFTQIRSGLISLQWQSIYERTSKVIKGAVLKTTDQVWVLVLKLRHEQDRVFLLWWFSGEEMKDKVNDGRWGMIWSHCFPLTKHYRPAITWTGWPTEWTTATQTLGDPVVTLSDHRVNGWVSSVCDQDHQYSNHLGQLCQLQSHLHTPSWSIVKLDKTRSV